MLEIPDTRVLVGLFGGACVGGMLHGTFDEALAGGLARSLDALADLLPFANAIVQLGTDLGHLRIQLVPGGLERFADAIELGAESVMTVSLTLGCTIGFYFGSVPWRGRRCAFR